MSDKKYIAIVWVNAEDRNPSYTMTHDPAEDGEELFARAAGFAARGGNPGRVLIAEIHSDDTIEPNDLHPLPSNNAPTEIEV